MTRRRRPARARLGGGRGGRFDRLGIGGCAGRNRRKGLFQAAALDGDRDRCRGSGESAAPLGRAARRGAAAPPPREAALAADLRGARMVSRANGIPVRGDRVLVLWAERSGMWGTFFSFGIVLCMVTLTMNAGSLNFRMVHDFSLCYSG
jgi:hypothetical protein